MPTITARRGLDPRKTDVHSSARSMPSSRHYTALDGLRGVAILAVMIYHFCGSYKGTNPLLRAWGFTADAGWMGVDLFFVLSGFLITGILYDTASTAHKVKNFYARRALRIFPLFYAVLLALLVLSHPLHLHWHGEHIFYFLYLSNIATLIRPGFQPPSHWVNLGHLWSLAVEEQFYLIWPFIVWRIKKAEALLKVILVVVVAEPLLRGLLFASGMDSVTISRLLLTRADTLLFGAGVALLVRTPAPHRVPATIILVLSAVSIGISLVFTHGADATSGWISTIGYTMIAACAASLVYLVQRGTRWTSYLFDRPVLRFFGRYSYGLYLFHGIYFVYLRHVAANLQLRIGSGVIVQLLAVLVGFGVSILLALLSYHMFEAPLLRLKSRFA